MKTNTKSIKFNFIMNAILSMSAILFPLITFPYVSRVLRPSGTGRVYFVSSVVTYFSMFSQLGIPIYGIRTCAKIREDKEQLSRTVHEIFIINFVMSIVVYVALILAVLSVPRFQREQTLFFVMSVSIFLNCIGMEWLYKGLELYGYITVRSIVFKLISILGMFLLIKDRSDYVIYGGIVVFASSASGILNFFYARKYISTKYIGGYQIKRHFRAIFVFFAMSCATVIYTNLDTVMLGFMKSDTVVGYYNAAVKIKGILVCVVTSLGTVLLPRASYYVENKQMDQFYEITGKAINFIFLIALPLSVYFMLFAKEGIFFLSGYKYAGAIQPMILIMPTLLVIGLTNIMGIQMLIPLGKEKIVLYSEIAGAVTDLILNMLLIPFMGASGAAIGTLCAEIVVWIVQYAVLRGKIIEAYREVSYIKFFVATVLASMISLFTKNIQVIPSVTANSFVVLVVSALLFFGVYLVVLIVSKEKMVGEACEMVRKKLKRV